MDNIFEELNFPFVLKLRASAGAGKTYQLMIAYLWLLSKQKHVSLDSLKSIVALTFTNQATFEMKHRILQGLKDIVLENDKGKALVKVTGLIPSQAKKWLDLILDRYFCFQVKTLDSFLFNLFRLLSLELGFPPTLKPEFNEEFVLNQLIDRLWRISLQDDNIQQLVSSLVDVFLEIEQVHGFNIENKLKSRLREVFFELYKIKKDISLNFDVDSLKYQEKRIKELGNKILNWVDEVGLEFKYSWRKAFLDPIRYFNSDKSSFLNKESIKEMCRANKNKDVLDFFKIDKYFFRFKKELDTYFYLKADLKLKPYIQICSILKDFLADYSREEGIVLPNDWMYLLEQKIKELDIPTIFAFLGERWKHFLIDEFQDTSNIQWNILKFFIQNSLAEGGSVFLVGDQKQSIYMWRDADPELFLNCHRELPNADFHEDTLKYNWRSSPYIIDFNNKVFSFFSSATNEIASIFKLENNRFQSKLKDYFSSLEQSVCEKNKNLKGKVKRFFKQEDWEQDFLRLLNNILENNELSNIAILVRSNEQAKEISSLLLAANIPVISENNLVLEASFVIKGLINFLRFVDDPMDDEKVLSFCLTPICPLENEFILKNYRELEKGLLWDWLKKQDLEEVAFLKYCVQKSAFLSVYELILEIVKEYSLKTKFPDHLAFLNRFLELIISLPKTKVLNICMFLKEWQIIKEKQKLGCSEHIDAVRVMTIHAAKGLEFDIVFLPFLDWNIPRLNILVLEDGSIVRVKKPYSANIASKLEQEKEKHILETLNLLYVAFTRAKRELYYWVEDSDKRKKNIPFLLKIIEETIGCNNA